MRIYSTLFSIYALILVSTICALGCATGLEVQSSIEPDGTVVDRMTGTEIGLEGEGKYSDYAIQGSTIDLVGVERYCYLDPSRHRAPDGTVTYFLEFTYSGPKELHIERRKSLELAVDGADPFPLAGRGDVTREHDEMNHTYVESFKYLVSARRLEYLANADEVDVIVTGRDFVLNGFFVKNTFKRYKTFVNDYVE